jgi:hypothetical protein
MMEASSRIKTWQRKPKYVNSDRMKGGKLSVPQNMDKFQVF